MLVFDTLNSYPIIAVYLKDYTAVPYLKVMVEEGKVYIYLDFAPS